MSIRATSGITFGNGVTITLGNPLTFSQTTNVNAANLTIPSTAEAGQLAILVDTPLGTSVPTLVIPSGWTSVYDFSATTTSSVRVSFSYKVLVAGDIGATITGMTGTAGSRKNLLIFQPSRVINTASGGGGVGSMVNGNPTVSAIATGSVAAPVVAIGVNYFSGTANLVSAGMTILDGGAVGLDVGYQIYNSSPTNTSISTPTSGTNNVLAGCYFNVTF